MDHRGSVVPLLAGALVVAICVTLCASGNPVGDVAAPPAPIPQTAPTPAPSASAPAARPPAVAKCEGDANEAAVRATKWLAIAEDAARWTNGLAVPVDAQRLDRGVRWRFAEDKAHAFTYDNLFDGGAGIVLFNLNLHRVTQKQEYKDLCLAGARGLLAELGEFRGSRARSGFYVGTAGTGWVELQVHLEYGDAACLAGAKRAADAIMARTPIANGRATVAEGDLSLISGASGTMMFFVDLARATGEKRYLDFAVACGDAILAREVHRDCGGSWTAGPGSGYGYLGMSHGVAGIGHALAYLFESTKEERFLKGATDAAEFLMSRAEDRDGGLAWPVYDVPSRGGWTAPEPQAGWCHGPAGTSRFFARMSRTVMDDTARQRYARAAARGADFASARLRSSTGADSYWGLTLCCGAAGVGDLLLVPELRDTGGKRIICARELGDYLASKADRSCAGTSRWIDSPSCAPIGEPCFASGLQTGSAGVGTFFLRLSVAESGSSTRLVDPPDRN